MKNKETSGKNIEHNKPKAWKKHGKTLKIMKTWKKQRQVMKNLEKNNEKPWKTLKNQWETMKKEMNILRN